MQTVEKWDIFEVSASGRTEGNPFTDYTVKGIFRGKNETVEADGFYDGEGVYKVRFMPSFEGEYTYEISGSFSEEKTTGAFLVTPPSPKNHGPVRVANTYHFAYEDGTPYYSVGTTCYVWSHQPEEIRKQTLEELSKGYFNKMRFCVFPKHYIHNFRDPETFPYEGTPVDNSGLTEENFSYNVDFSGNHWDFKRFHPEHFRRFEACIAELRDRGIEADIIVMHPYDRWGFSAMSREEDDLYWKYVVARFAAYRNVWWSHGGKLHGDSPERIRFLHQILCETPGLGLKRGTGSFDETVGVPEGMAPDSGYEIHYYGFGRPTFREFRKEPDARYQAEVIDTWGMTVTDAGIHSGKFRIPLPGREYMAIRLRRLPE